RTPSADLRRAVPRYPPRRGRPTRSPRAGCRLLLRGRLGRRGFLRRSVGRGLGDLLDGGLRRGGFLLAAVRAVRAGQDAVEPLGGGFLVHVLRVHQLAGQDLLGLDEHLLLARREPFVAVAQGQVPDDLGQLEDVAGLHLVPVVLEAAVPVLGHLRAAAGERLDDDLDHVLADHLPEADLLGVLGRNVDGHVVVQDLDRQVLALLAEDLTLFLLYDRTCPVVRIHHLVADFVQARPFPSYVTATPAGKARRRRDGSVAKGAGNAHFLGYVKENPCSRWLSGPASLQLEVPVDQVVLLEAAEALPDLPGPDRADPGNGLEVALGGADDRLQTVHVRDDPLHDLVGETRDVGQDAEAAGRHRVVERVH